MKVKKESNLSEESRESGESSLSEEASDSNESLDKSLETTFKTEQTVIPDVYDSIIGKFFALIYILLFTNLNMFYSQGQLSLNLLYILHYIGVISFQRITFTIRIIFVFLEN